MVKYNCSRKLQNKIREENMGMKTIQPGQIQNEKLVAIRSWGPSAEFNPSISDFTTFMINLNNWEFPKTIKISAYELQKADKILKTTKAQYDLAEGQRRIKLISASDYKKFQDRFDTANQKTEKLFAQVKSEYMVWVDKNIPKNIIVDLSATILTFPY